MTDMQKTRLQLIITADDFGYSLQRNLAIKELFNERKISRTTLLMNGRYTTHAWILAEQFRIPVGLHFNLTEGKPLSDPEDVKSLVDIKTGLFHGKLGFREKIKHGQISPLDIERELIAQIHLYKNNFSASPPFIDGHQHVHVIPEVAQVIGPHFRKFGVFQTRIPSEDLSGCYWIYPSSRLEFYAQVCRDALEAKEIYKAHAIDYPSTFLGLSLMGQDMTMHNMDFGLSKVINKTILTEDIGDCELMTHPGHAIPPFTGGCFGTNGEDDFSTSPARTHELNFLRSKSFEELLKRKGVDLQHSTANLRSRRRSVSITELWDIYLTKGAEALRAIT